jgi:hypothetical protein
MVERAVLHHQDHEVVDLHVPRARHARPSRLGLGGLSEQHADRQRRRHARESGPVGRPLEELAPAEILVAHARPA